MRKAVDFIWKTIVKYKDLLIFIPAFFIYALIMHFSGIHCPIKFLTGISCAGCGMTRAYVSLLRGDISGAFHSHPLFILPPLVSILIINKKRLRPLLYRIFLFTTIAVFVIVYVCRLIKGGSEIVVFEPQNGLIMRSLRFLNFYQR